MEGPNESKSAFWPLQLGGWAIFFAAMFFAGVAQWPLAYTIARKTALATSGFAITLLLRLPYRLLRRRGAAITTVAFCGVAFSALGAGLWMAAYNFVMTAFVLKHPGAAIAHFPDLTNTIYYSFVLIAWSTLYFAIPRVLEERHDRERLANAVALAQQAELRALRLQLNPHFLFNSLNAISTLIADAKNAEANRMLVRLSDFLRMTLTTAQGDEIAISEEIEFARQYLFIERSRFEERLQIAISIADEARSGLVPPMILQPLVENAVRHAILPRENGGIVAIRVTRENGCLRIAVSDDGPGLDPLKPAGSGIGLRNVRDRLSHLYGARGALTLSRSDLGGAAVTLEVPFHETPL